MLLECNIYFPGPMSVLTPPVCVCVRVQKTGRPRAKAVGGEQEAGASEALHRAAPLTHGI